MTDVVGKGSSSPRLCRAALSLTLLVTLAWLCSFLFSVASASAATVTQRPLLFTFDGSGASTGPLTNPHAIAIDNATGDVYITNDESNGENGYLSKFTSAGVPASFSATGSSLLPLGPSTFLGVAVDNSGGPTQSRILLSEFVGNKLKSFAPNGELQWSLGQSENVRDVAVDVFGHPWALNGSTATEYANTGSPPAIDSSFSVGGSRIDLDASENVYVNGFPEVTKYVGGVPDSTLDPSAKDVYANQSSASGNIFTVDSANNEQQEFQVDATGGQFRLAFEGDQTPDLPYDATYEEIKTALEALPSIAIGNVRAGLAGLDSEHRFYVIFQNLLGGVDVEPLNCENGTTPLTGGSGCNVTTATQGSPGNFEEYNSSGAHLATFGTEYLGNGNSIAYNPTLDRVYVVQNGAKPSVAVFGPETTGTVADTATEAPSSVGVSSAHFSGTVNPQGTSSEWRFQWRRGSQSWTEASSSPPQSLPADSSDHTVEYTTGALSGNTSYQVRLVAVNSANQLAGISATKTFTTATSAQAPTVTIAAPSQIAPHTARVTGTIDPEGDTADWRVQTSTDPACVEGFKDQALQELTPAGSSPIDIEYELTGLLPSEHYCARIVATNSAGSTTSESKEFQTADAPLQAFTAYAAPRTATTARLNGYVDPEGSQVTYHFEYSQDGVDWTTLPDLTSPRARRQIAVGEEVTGLTPNTTYHYRFLAENGAGVEEGEDKTFTTRTTAEMELPTRGVEMVNKPDKGNQNIAPLEVVGPRVSVDGNRAVWSVISGAPGGNSGTYVNFLAERSPSGWVNKPIIPAAGEQVGGGALTYKLSNVTPDLRHFVAEAIEPRTPIENGPPTYVRLDDEQHQDVLQASNVPNEHSPIDISDDGAHVLRVSEETGELEDLSSGTPEVVSIMPDGTPSQCPAFFTSSFSGQSLAHRQWRSGYHRMSADAERVYFQAVPNGLPCATGRQAIFYRDRAAGITVEVDPGSSESPEESLAMVRSTPDGKSLYFITTTSHVAEDSNNARDIYRWDAESNEYSCLTCVVANPGLTTNEQPVLISNDFSHIYFISTRQLLPGRGEAGDQNLYVLRHGQLGFVVDVGSSDVTNSGQLSADGNVLTWYQGGGIANLTSDQLGECRSFQASDPSVDCHEFYRYEDSTESLECISCLHDGPTRQSAGEIGAQYILGQSADGSTTAFVTGEALVPEDINHTFDIYEWRNGALGLVSDGETKFPASGFFNAPKVYGVDATGANVFFWLNQPGLTGYEQDGFTNLYDARIGGGFPRPQPPQHCSEESCQGPLQAPPGQPSSGSSGLSGAGNVPPSPGKGRCARKHGKARSRCLHPRKHRQRKGHKRRAAHRAATPSNGGAK